MMKKWMIGIMILLVLLGTGCAKEEETSLQFRITWDENSGRGECLEAIVDSFNADHENITVELVGGNEDAETYKQELSEGLIDVYVVPYRYLKYKDIASQFATLDLAMEDLQKIHYDSIIDMMTYQNEVVGMPWIGHSMALIYNKDITKHYDVHPNKWQSLDDLLVACETISEGGKNSVMGMIGANHHDLSWMVTQFIYTFDGKLVETKASCEDAEIVVNSEATQVALNYYINELGPYGQDNWESHTGVDVMTAFANEEIAFEIQGPWGVTDIWKRGHPFDIGVIPLSQIGMNSEVGPLMLAMPKGIDHREEARLFLDYMCSEQAMNQIMAGEYDAKYDAYYPFRVPIRKDMQDSVFFKQYPEFNAFVMGFEQPSINTPCPEWSEEQKNKFTKGIHSAIMGEIDIKMALEGIK